MNSRGRGFDSFTHDSFIHFSNSPFFILNHIHSRFRANEQLCETVYCGSIVIALLTTCDNTTAILTMSSNAA